jgi:hypothetical protein
VRQLLPWNAGSAEFLFHPRRCDLPAQGRGNSLDKRRYDVFSTIPSVLSAKPRNS